MKFHLTAQQSGFYAEHGYIGFENLPLDLSALKQEIDSHKLLGRDLWRKSSNLQNVLVRKLGPIGLQLSRRKLLYLACDHWFDTTTSWDTSCAIQSHLSFQGLALVVCLFFDGKTPCFFMQPSTWPQMIPHWPKEPTDCYLVAYGDQTTRYIDNPKDHSRHLLKKWGFAYGDLLLKNPMIISS